MTFTKTTCNGCHCWQRLPYPLLQEGQLNLFLQRHYDMTSRLYSGLYRGKPASPSPHRGKADELLARVAAEGAQPLLRTVLIQPSIRAAEKPWPRNGPAAIPLNSDILEERYPRQSARRSTTMVRLFASARDHFFTAGCRRQPTANPI